MELDLFKLWLFWERHGTDNKLSTTGVRKLTLMCFGWIDKNGRMMEPLYPFWKQSQFIRDVIIAMLRTHLLGREVIKDILLWKRCFNKLQAFIEPASNEESKMMGEIVKAVYEFIKETSNKIM